MSVIDTLPALLSSRAYDSSSRAKLHFLDSQGEIVETLSALELFESSVQYAGRLLSAGLTSSDTVLASFPDHSSHIRLFWACILAGIPFSPLPAPHPDPSRYKLLLDHLQTVFVRPTLIGSADTIHNAQKLSPNLRGLSSDDIQATASADKLSLIFPARKIQASDTVCYMLTSGSTGNSKAVVLTHANLLSSIRGKVFHHKSTPDSKFLNWIAFDHVACLSEIHLQALEANASQYHVTPSAIVQRPANLLEWTAKYDITYSFSPNFLISQILRDSESIAKIDLSSLRVFISGGEAVPITTAVKFADLLETFGAPRNTLRAGFGMSETGAGSIYDTRPIPTSAEVTSKAVPPYLSLGQCCPGISMHVVDISTGQKLPPGTIGHLVVEGPTVFAQYYGNVEATRSAFPLNDKWFLTGDLAQIDSEGNLFLEGRAKDNLNINGVKYLPIDVASAVEDTHISGVVAGSVQVCPLRVAGADTETFVVFFQHEIDITGELDLDQKIALNASRSAIRDACVLFCSQTPHIVLPLPAASLARTSLGKVSGAQLVKSFEQGDFDYIVTSLDNRSERGPSDLTTEVDFAIGLLVSVLFSVDLETLRRSDNIFDMGASSMHLMRLKHEIQAHLQLRSLPTVEMLKRPVLGELSDYITSLVAWKDDAPYSVEYNPLVCFNANGSKPPLFLVHPGVGEVLVFVNLARVLEDDRPVYALRAKGFDYGDPTFDTFEEMVECYANEMMKVYPNGPYYIAGYSFGGAVAFSVAKFLEAKGKKVAFVGVLNLPPHIQFRMKELVWVEVLLNITMFLSLTPEAMLPKLREQILVAFPELKVEDAVPKDAIKPITWVFERCDQDRLVELDLEINAFVRWVQVAYEINRTGRTFEPSGKVDGALLSVFCAIPLPSMGTREEFKRDRLSAWKDFSSPRFEMIDVDGEHYTMLGEEHVESFAVHLRGALARADLPSPALPVSRGQGVFDAVPIVDFSLSITDKPAYLKQLEYALQDVGFGIITNLPGLDDDFQKECFSLCSQFFERPQELKDRLGTENSPSLRGYFSLNNNNSAHKAHAEAFRVGAERPSPGALGDPSIPFWLKLHEGPNQWPDDIPGFQSTMAILYERYRVLNLQLNAHVCEILSIPNEVLDDFFPTKTEFNSAMWHYFPYTPEIVGEAKEGFANGMHEHRDPSTFLTLLIQNRPGLQAQNHEGKWIDIPFVKGGVVCNVGMQLMRLTGGKLVATTHRVNTLKIDKDRYTIPYVLTTKLEKPVIPLPQFSSTDVAKAHVAPNPKIQKLMAIEDPLIRSGYARLTLFPAATQKLYPKEFAEAQQMGLV